MTDVIETKRARPPDYVAKAGLALTRPIKPAPSSSAKLEAREAWAQQFVAWFIEVTGGDVHPDGGPAGHRWRMEYFACVRDPQAFEQRAEQEVAVYQSRGGE